MDNDIFCRRVWLKKCWSIYIRISLPWYMINPVGHISSTDLHHDDVIKWKHFSRNWLFVRGIHRSPVNSPHKGQWREALMFSLIPTWTNGWVNNREAGDLRRHRTHYDVIVVMNYIPRNMHMYPFSFLLGWSLFVFILSVSNCSFLESNRKIIAFLHIQGNEYYIDNCNLLKPLSDYKAIKYQHHIFVHNAEN